MSDREKFVQLPVTAVRSSLSDSAFRLLGEIATYAWESSGSVCTASQATLAEDLKWSRDKVQRAARELEQIGYLNCVHEPGKPNRYSLTYRNAAAPTYRNAAAPPAANSRPVPAATLRHKADEGETDERSRRPRARSQAQPVDDHAERLAAFIEEQTGTRPTFTTADSTRLAALLSNDGRDEVNQRVMWALASDFWRRGATDKLSRLISPNAWAEIGKQMAGESKREEPANATKSQWESVTYDDDQVRVHKKRATDHQPELAAAA